jgi:hypothetical protein
MSFYDKYIKYKNKYLYLKNQIGGISDLQWYITDTGTKISNEKDCSKINDHLIWLHNYIQKETGGSGGQGMKQIYDQTYNIYKDKINNCPHKLWNYTLLNKYSAYNY